MDGESLGQGFLLSGVDLSEEHWWVLLTELLSSGGILWVEFLAVTTIVKGMNKYSECQMQMGISFIFEKILTTMGRRIQQEGNRAS